MAKKSKKVLNIQRRSTHQQQSESQVEALSSEDAVSTTYYVHGPQGIHAQKKDGDWTWMIQDGVNSVRGITDNDLAVLQSILYDPFGNPLAVVGPDQTVYGYTGEPTDLNDLVYLRERYYNPAIGTFISQDSIEGSPNIPMSLNRYAYVQGNPVNLTDPSGRVPIAQALNNTMASDPLGFVQMMNAGLCFLAQADPCAGYAGQAYIDCRRGLLPTMTPSPTLTPTGTPVPCPSSYAIPGVTPTPSVVPPFPTNTPRPPSTPTVTLRLPIGDATTSDAILTPYGCQWATSNGSPLKSRDANPRCLTAAGTYAALGGIPANVYAPVPQAEVMIVDEDAGPLGKFVALRVSSDYLPNLGLGNGYLYIGFSHLSQINVSAGNGQAPYPITGSQPVGVTGHSGTDNIHLDIMTFFVSNGGARPAPVPAATVTLGEINLQENSDAFFRLAGIGNWAAVFASQEVDPVTIWPPLADGSVCG